MALEHILAAIEQETDLQLDRIRADGASQRDDVLADGREQARKVREEAMRARQAALDRERARVLADADVRADRLVREAREQVFSDALEGTRQALEALRGDPERYRVVLSALIAEGVRALPTADRCEVDPGDVTLATGLADGLRVEAGETGWGGVVLTDPAGRRVDNTLHTRLSTAMLELRVVAATVLWGQA